MATTTVSDFVIWTKHIHGDAGLVARLAAMKAGETLNLRVDGVPGTWRKMDDGKDGRPTPGLRPLGRAQDHWRALYKSRRGDLVALDLKDDELFEATGVSETGSVFEPARASAAPKLVRTEESRKAALEALLAQAGKGWRSDGRKMTRDEMNER